MAIQIITNFETNSPKPLDARVGPYGSVAEANASIPTLFRYIGQTIIITGSGLPADFHYAAGITDNDLVQKSAEAGTGFPFTGSAGIMGDLHIEQDPTGSNPLFLVQTYNTSSGQHEEKLRVTNEGVLLLRS